MPNTESSVAGLCVTVRPENLDDVETLLGGRTELEVHARDRDSGRLIVVQECRSIKDHRRNLEEIQVLPGVLTAELVIHYSDPESETDPQTPGGVL
jgi:nitrate reductase NapAB chaperone NapD